MPWLLRLAAPYDNQSRYSEAEPLYKRALAIDEKVIGAFVHKVNSRKFRLLQDKSKLSNEAKAMREQVGGSKVVEF